MNQIQYFNLSDDAISMIVSVSATDFTLVLPNF